jgi:hypothetical protein
MSDRLLESIAAVVHDEWVSWSKELAGKEILSDERLVRWHKMWIPYERLPEDMKDFDRIWARKIINALKWNIGLRLV